MQHALSVDGVLAPGHWTGERLDSWKEVASFFRKEVRTVQLWEKGEGLPIRRQYHKKLGSVYAYRSELEAWWIARAAVSSGYGQPRGERQAAAHKIEDVPASRDSELPRILVLPFEVMHSPLDRGPLRQIVDRFVEGLREDLIVELRRLHLQPIILPAKAIPSAGTSTLAFLKNIAKEFAADALTSGSVRYFGNQARLSVQLVRGEDSSCVWAERYDLALDNILHAQSEVAFRISQSLPHQALRRVPPAKHAHTTDHAPAYHACMMGFHYWKQRSKPAMTKAVGYFQDAIALDPGCPDAYAGLADTYVSLSYNHLMPARQAADLASEAVHTAMNLDKRSLKVRNAQINLLINCTWDWHKAERACQDLISSDSMDVRTLQLYSTLMNAQGRHDEAISLALHGHRLEPHSDLMNGQVAIAYFYAGDYGSALSFTRRTIELQPQFIMGYAMLGRTEAELGNWDKAVAAFNQGLEVSNCSPFMLALLAYAHAGGGDAQKANSILRELEASRSDGCYPAYDISAVHALLNQEQEALQHIFRAYDTRDMKTIFVHHDPRFAKLRTSRGFQQIAASMCGV